MADNDVDLEQNLAYIFSKSKNRITTTLRSVNVFLSEDYGLNSAKLSSVAQHAEALAKSDLPNHQAEFGNFCCMFAAISSGIVKCRPVELAGIVNEGDSELNDGTTWVNAIYAFFSGVMYCQLPLEATSDEGAARVIRYLAASRPDDALLQCLSAARIFRDAYVRKGFFGRTKMISPKDTQF